MILELCKGVHCVDLGESVQTHIFLQHLASIQPRTSPPKFGRRRRTLSGGSSCRGRIVQLKALPWAATPRSRETSTRRSSSRSLSARRGISRFMLVSGTSPDRGSRVFIFLARPGKIHRFVDFFGMLGVSLSDCWKLLILYTVFLRNCWVKCLKKSKRVQIL